MNLREWLFIAGVAIILGILVDGLRRMRLAKQDSLKMSRDLGGHIESSPLDDDFNPELPAGGARVISTNDDGSEGDSKPNDNSEDSAPKDVPTNQDTPPEKIEPSLGFELTADSNSEPEGLVGEVRVVRPEVASKKTRAKESTKKKARGKVSAKAQEKKASNTGSQQEHEVIVINVDAPSGKKFSGMAIKNLLEACGMKHGDMSIFHRHEEEDLLSPIQFSVANAVEPGYFDPDKIEELETPGVSFFMSVPGPKDYLKAFEFMNETARCFSENLHGELKDENRSVLTAQTVEHCRQRIREFERKQLCKMR